MMNQKVNSKHKRQTTVIYLLNLKKFHFLLERALFLLTFHLELVSFNYNLAWQCTRSSHVVQTTVNVQTLPQTTGPTARECVNVDTLLMTLLDELIVNN